MSRTAFSAEFNKVRTLTLTALGGAALTTFAANTGLFKFTMPFTGKLVGASLNVHGRGGTHATSTLDVKAGGVSCLASTFNVAGLTPGTIVNKEGDAAFSATGLSIAKDAVVTVETAVSGGSSPTWSDVTLTLDIVPLGD